MFMKNDCTASFRSISITGRARGRALWLGLCALGVTFAASAHEPRFITIDAPGAGTASGQGTGCFAFTDCSVLINDEGEITGYFLDTNNVFHGFLRSPAGKFTSFDAQGADTAANDFNGTLPVAINDAGAITGTYYDANNVAHGFLRSREGEFTSFDVPDSTATIPIGLNLESAVVGYYVDQNSVFHAFLRRRDGSFATWSGPDQCTSAPPGSFCGGSGAFSINIFGTVSAAYADKAFAGHGLIRTPTGKLLTYNVPWAGAGSGQGTGCPGCARPLNIFGAIASYYIDANNVTHGFVRSPKGDFVTFDPAGEGPFGIGCGADCSIGLNDWGAITGSYYDVNNVSRGFLRSPEGSITTFQVPGADTTPNSYNGTYSVSINDRGAITGFYFDANNVSHGFLQLPAD
jgi:hypothetical protein